MDLLDMVQAETVYRPGDRIEYIYFPLTAVLSMSTILHDGSRVEVATLGNEGMTGVPLSSPRAVSPILMTCTSRGECLRMTTKAFGTWLQNTPSARELLDRTASTLLGVVAQSVVCHRMHGIEERAACWLLITRDRVRSNTFSVTQQLLADVLGVRRATVNAFATSMKRLGLVRYHRGTVEIIDTKGLEAVACECYEVARQHRAALMKRRSEATPLPAAVEIA